jgi:lambda family phage portal protein
MTAAAKRRRRSSSGTPPTVSAVFDTLRADYQAAGPSRFRSNRPGVGPVGRSADYHVRSERHLMALIEWAREHDRNDPLVGQAVDRVVDNVKPGAFGLNPKTGDEADDALLRDRFNRWAVDKRACDASHRDTFADLSALALRQMIVDGDAFGLLTKAGSVQVVEAHRCRTPTNTKRNVVHGVLLDSVRRPLEYWFTREDLNPSLSPQRVGDMRQVQADGVLHVVARRRSSQTRGVTALAPVLDTTGMHADLQFSQLIKAQVAACFAVFREVPLAVRDMATSDHAGEQSTESLGDGSTRTIEGIGPGMDVTGRPGEKLQGFSPNVPNAEFFQHAQLLITFLAINLGLPRQVLLLDPSDTNFSGWRGAIDQARLGFARLQRRLIDQWHAPVYRWLVGQWLADDPEVARIARDARARGRGVFDHEWNPPTWAYIEPTKDAQADDTRLRRNLSSARRVAAERGVDYDALAAEIVADRRRLVVLAIEAAAEVNDEHPEARVDWRDLAGIDVFTPPTAGSPGVPFTSAAEETTAGEATG